MFRLCSTYAWSIMKLSWLLCSPWSHKSLSFSGALQPWGFKLTLVPSRTPRNRRCHHHQNQRPCTVNFISDMFSRFKRHKQPISCCYCTYLNLIIITITNITINCSTWHMNLHQRSQETAARRVWIKIMWLIQHNQHNLDHTWFKSITDMFCRNIAI